MNDASETRKRVAIIGAGPIGLEAALRFQSDGFDTQIYERDSVAANVVAWGHVQLFSPFGMNSSSAGRAALAGEDLPPLDACLLGREFARRYLVPLSQLPVIVGGIHEQTDVQSIGRSRLRKSDVIGQPQRADDPFQLLLKTEHGERVDHADIVLDCSGVYGNHNFIGAGGLRCVGESNKLKDRDYQIPDILGTQRAEYSGRQTLVIGSGYSAATAVTSIAHLAAENPGTSAVWITRTKTKPPMNCIENDTLIKRDHLARAANSLATDPDSPIDWKPAFAIHVIEHHSNKYRVYIESAEQSGEKQREVLTVDRVIANVGNRPDRSLYEELQFHECYATQGPIKLAAALLGETSPDCMSQASPDADVLRNPEPNFFVLGAKSYGRDSRFLIKIGLEQIDTVRSMLDHANY